MTNIPVIATGQCYHIYLEAARRNLDNLLKLATGFKDDAFVKEAEFILEAFNNAAEDAMAMIAQANDDSNGIPADTFWRESAAAQDRGMGQ